MSYAKRSAAVRTMVRKSFCVTPELARRLERRAKELGVSQSEVVRRCLEAYLDRVDLLSAKKPARR